MSRQDLDLAVEWAAQEGWNPGLHDAEIFYKTDPSGFFIGALDGQPIGSISAVAYGDSFGFIGFYMVKPEYRAQGYGIQLWQHAMNYLSGRNIGLDGVVAQQENYRKSGFQLAYNNSRYGGKGCHDCSANAALVDLKTIAADQIVDYDRRFFPVSRPQFILPWIQHPAHTAIGMMQDSTLRGFGVLRPCREGHKIGPLFADSVEIATSIFQTLSHSVMGEPIYFDVPEGNLVAAELAKQHGMSKVFETARMYTGTPPNLPLQQLFGVTTFELG